MARLSNGILGGFSGKAGSIIGYQRGGKAFIKGAYKKTTKKPTINQLASRLRFKIIQDWRSYLTPVFAITFRNHRQECSAQNAAHRHNAEIVKGEYPNYEIDYEKIVISQGDLPPLQEVTMTMDESNHLHFAWNNTADKGGKQGDLITVLVCYNEKSFYECSTVAAHRSDKKLSYQLNFKGFEFGEVYITVISDDRERAANSKYMGRIVPNN